MDYTAAVSKLAPRESRKIGNNTYLQRREDGSIAVRLHDTDVLTFHPDGRTVYNSGGWRTVTTKERMNAYGPLRVYTERGVWYACPPSNWDSRVTYADGLTVKGDEITGTGTPPDERGDKRAVSKFVKAYMAALERGEVPAPGPGDCFFCGMREVETRRPLGECTSDAEHIRSHFEEGYYVPSLLARALEVFGASPASRNWVASYWDTSAPAEVRDSYKVGFYADHGRRVCAKALRRYLLRQLGYHA